MNGIRPRLTLRIGTHAEKEYFEKLGPLLDGLLVGANLVESTSGATSSLILNLAGPPSQVAYYIDPMTYAFGTYVDRSSSEVRKDLDWIKSDQKVKGQKGKTRRAFKSSYFQLADEFGVEFKQARDRSTAILPAAFPTPQSRSALAATVLDYQLTRIRREFESDPEFKHLAERIPAPAALFAPYFYCEPSATEGWLALNVELALEAAKLKPARPVHAILCADVTHLGSAAFLDRVKEAYPRTGIEGIWLWFSRFAEDAATSAQLAAFRSLVESLAADGLEVHNLHGGYFSLALSKFGLTGTSHGVGYGEQKDVVPIIGKSVPTVRYYLPPVYKKLGVPEIAHAFTTMGVKTVADFHAKVCGCAVCRGIVVNDLSEFIQYFGEVRPAASNPDKDVQTPQAARRCRFHFLVNRIRERDEMAALSVDQLRARFEAARVGWGSYPTLSRDSKHLEKWREVLK